MADSYFAASSTTGPGSSERIANEFMAQGRPDAPGTVVEGECLGGFQVVTPKVGDGFIEWAISGYDLEGKTKSAPPVNYDKHGDWLFDKTSHTLPTTNGLPEAKDYYNENYAKNGTQTPRTDKIRKEG